MKYQLMLSRSWKVLKKNKTTPQNVKEAHEALFHAKMNLPDAANHCGMTQKELKMTFFEYLKYNAPNTQVTELSLIHI